MLNEIFFRVRQGLLLGKRFVGIGLDMSTRYLVKKNGAESGPYSQEQVLTLVDNGSLSSSDFACFARKWRWLGQDHWFPVEWLRHPPSAREIRIPRSTVPRLVISVCILLAVVCILVIRLLRK